MIGEVCFVPRQKISVISVSYHKGRSKQTPVGAAQKPLTMMRCCGVGAQPLSIGIAQLGRRSAHARPVHVRCARRRNSLCTATAQTARPRP